jgi:hypothetical protein
LAVLATVWAGIYQSIQNRQLEREKFESQKSIEQQKATYQTEANDRKFKSDLTLNAIKTGNPKDASDNLLFLIEAKLLDDPNNSIREALKKYQPSLPSNVNIGSANGPLRFQLIDLENQASGEQKLIYRNLRLKAYAEKYENHKKILSELGKDKNSVNYLKAIFLQGIFAEWAGKLTEARDIFALCLQHPKIKDKNSISLLRRPIEKEAKKHFDHLDTFLKSGEAESEYKPLP